jgi:tRNA-dihydrouridine synthase
MFATAVRLLATKSAGPKPVKLSKLGDGVQPAIESLFNILKDHGPLTVQDCWKHASQLENSSFRSKRHMKLILRWMRENRRVRKVCNSIGERPDEREFVFSVEPPKIERKNPSIPQEDNTTTTTLSSE